MKTKDWQETLHSWLWLQKDSSQKKWVDKGTEVAGEFRKLCTAGGKQIYSTLSETKAAFAERTIRSLKNILHRFLEDKGYKYFHKLTHIVTTLNFRRNCSIDLKPKNAKNSDILSILYSKELREHRKPRFEIADRVRISKYDLAFRKGYKPQFTEEVFKIVAISSRKPPTYSV